MKLYITRHGETEWNVAQRLQGWKDSDLTKDGIERAVRLGERLTKINFDIIYSSTQNRAIHSAKLIRGNKDTSIIVREDIRELGFGSWEGMQLEDIEVNWPEEFYNYINRPHMYNPVNGESLQDLFKRVKSFLDEITTKDYDNILIVTHGVTIKAIITILKGLEIKDLSAIPVFTGTALNIYELNGNEVELLLEGDTTHIESEY